MVEGERQREGNQVKRVGVAGRVTEKVRKSDRYTRLFRTIARDLIAAIQNKYEAV